jgi:hypothetical protein
LGAPGVNRPNGRYGFEPAASRDVVRYRKPGTATRGRRLLPLRLVNDHAEAIDEYYWQQVHATMKRDPQALGNLLAYLHRSESTTIVETN